MYLSINLSPEKTKELELYIKSILPEVINENIFADTNKLKSLINECVKGQIKATINDLMQGQDFRNFLRNKILEQIGMKEKNDNENHI